MWNELYQIFRGVAEQTYPGYLNHCSSYADVILCLQLLDEKQIVGIDLLAGWERNWYGDLVVRHLVLVKECLNADGVAWGFYFWEAMDNDYGNPFSAAARRGVRAGGIYCLSHVYLSPPHLCAAEERARYV